MGNLSALAYAVRQALLARGQKLSIGHVQQLVAAAFGHNNLASYQASSEDGRLHLARHIVADVDMLRERADDLQVPADTSHAALLTALAERFPQASIHRDLDDYLIELQERAERDIVNDDTVNSEVAMTNGTFPRADFELPFWGTMDPEGTDDLHADFEVLVVVDQDEDRIYWGHEVEVSGSLSVERLGRRLFGRRHVDVTRAKLRWMGESSERYDEAA